MGHKNKINFFWSGDDWSYLHDLTIKSHIVSNHQPVIWLHGGIPNSLFWDDTGVIVNDADSIVDITDFMKKGGNFKTASSLWRFTYLYEYGGWYADTDAMALREWPDDEWVVCKNYKDLLSTGVLKVPPKQPMFLDMIENLKYGWGNVKVFNESYNKYNIDRDGTVEGGLFFPYTWESWKTALSSNSTKIDNVSEGYSVHLYHTMYERANMIDSIEQWIRRNDRTLLGRLDRWVKGQIKD